MYDEVAVIEQDPYGALVTLDSCSCYARLLYLLVDLGENRLHSPLVLTADHAEVVGETRDFAQIKDYRIDRFLFAGRVKRRADALVDNRLAGLGLWVGPHGRLRVE